MRQLPSPTLSVVPSIYMSDIPSEYLTTSFKRAADYDYIGFSEASAAVAERKREPVPEPPGEVNDDGDDDDDDAVAAAADDDGSDSVYLKPNMDELLPDDHDSSSP